MSGIARSDSFENLENRMAVRCGRGKSAPRDDGLWSSGGARAGQKAGPLAYSGC